MNLLNLCNYIVVIFTYYFLNAKVCSIEIDCELIENCSFAKAVLSRKYNQKPAEIWKLFNISKCGYEDKTNKLKIWCPKFSNCTMPSNEFGTCIPEKTCLHLALYRKINITSYLNSTFPYEEYLCGPDEDVERLVCCPSPVKVSKIMQNPGLKNNKRTSRKKRNNWLDFNNNNRIFGFGQNPYYDVNKGYGVEASNFNLPNFGYGSGNNIFAQNITNFYDQLRSGQTSQINQLQNSLTKQNKWFQVALEDRSKKLSEAQQNFSKGLLNSWSWFPEQPDYSKYNLTEEMSVTTHEVCMTPENFEGICKPFRQCLTFMNALSNVHNTDNVQIEYLKKFRCNSTESNENKTQVCCSENPIILPNATTRVIESKSENEASADNPLDSFSDICGRESLDDKIIGGTTTGLAEFPWTAVLYYTSPKGLSFACGGTVISNRYIVTAAHCVNLIILEQAGLQKLQQVVLGEFDRRNETDCIYTPFGSDCADPPQSFGVERIIEHEQFRSNGTPNDIALVRLDRNINFSDYVRPICLPTTGSLNLKGNETFVITGWGKTETGESSPVKRKAILPLISKNNCGQVGPLGDGQMCFGSGMGTDSCKGDSGGPVMLHTIRKSGDLVTTLIGIISFGFGRCGTTTSVSTSVPHYLDWIVKNIS